MKQHGSAAFIGGTRSFYDLPSMFGGTVIFAYQNPEWHLKARGMIEETASNAPGTWYRLTEKGAAACPKTDPNAPRR
jgi:hypothetical protein